MFYGTALDRWGHLTQVIYAGRLQREVARARPAFRFAERPPLALPTRRAPAFDPL